MAIRSQLGKQKDVAMTKLGNRRFEGPCKWTNTPSRTAIVRPGVRIDEKPEQIVTNRTTSAQRETTA